ncbi:oligosaccharide translocation protein RFT1 [Yarrowia lipolytica]|uniref:Man(5)GlcNAc(2)-PP-dolichol translocation protein RFT1 n=2 Tax=Yarrowia lipolytica TaxID=4952 RepID=RFT1_YARLI|nr:YALI0E06721p [Yarrowia lipolytica CLIB122]Q6C6S3.1 RecName: Full=Oligosaccharide translocation protein RFT1 [Yarrowia lipolytica CLIB122]AOW05052.1 hypothetical protein YALI1_E08071g [Yarrowia lipolytica]KAB8286135.1 oligosaccharide translocation protein RFT1 [Yarrowia lipolytica]KAE8171399.1 oligosaccharide translocation protein RFT1 [Yarrowia lipolytica]KAJ8056615.1 oligosaccharide translocation protein RFT1 [Yarrowia lipolytica]QNP98832.1 Oligosaccharide translocation protein RFT1 [Yarr|eukprot:XP_503639.1 YALI0E06721p [Yarrowia lipolytica CLIB122]
MDELPSHEPKNRYSRSSSIGSPADARYAPPSPLHEPSDASQIAIAMGGVRQRSASIRKHRRQQPSQVFIPPMHENVTAPRDEHEPKMSSPVPETDEKPLLQTSAAGATLLIGIQILSKLASFGLNQMLLLVATPALFGANAQLEFVLNTVLFFSREAVRLALQRLTLAGKKPDVYVFGGGVVQDTVSGTSQAVINMGYISVLLGVFFSSVAAASHSLFSVAYASWAVQLVCIAAMVDLASEPYYVLAMQQLRFRSRAAAEAVAILVRCVVTFSFTLLAKDTDGGLNGGVLAFAFGQLAYSLISSAVYIYTVRQDNRDRQFSFRPQKIQPFESQMEMSDNNRDVITHNASPYYLDKPTVRLAGSIWIQTVFKHCLTEGDRILVSYFLPLYDQGVYAIVLNYGSLVARIVFFPIEEGLRTFFSNLLGEKPSETALKLSRQVLCSVVRIYTYVALFAAGFGPTTLPFIFGTLLGARGGQWSEGAPSRSAPAVMGAFALYIPFMALNGALESFVQSVATPADLRRQAVALGVFSVVFATVGGLLMKTMDLGARGLVFANIVNMTLRIGWSVVFIYHYYVSHKAENVNPTHLLPGKLVIATGVTTILASLFGVGRVSSFRDVGINIGLALALAAAIAVEERQALVQLVQLVRKKEDKVKVDDKEEKEKESDKSEGESE